MDSTALGLAAFRKFNTDGVPASGARRPPKQEILDWIASLGVDLDSLLSQISLANPQTARALVSGYADIGIKPTVVQAGAGPGRVTLTHTPHQFARHRSLFETAQPSRCWVDPAGNDAGTGAFNDPFATIAHAASVSTASRIFVRSGTYEPPNINLLTDSTAFASGRYTKYFYLEPGTTIAIAGPRLQDATWTLHSGTAGIDAIYKTTLTLTGAQTVGRLARVDQFDAYGQPLTFRQYTSVANLTASSAATSGWFIETAAGNKVIYVRLAGGLSVIVNKSALKAFYLDTSADASWKVGGIPCAIQAVVPGTVLFDGVGIVGSQVAGGFNAELFLDGLFSRFAPLMSYQCNGGTNFIRNCVGHASFSDCFNWNAGNVNNAASFNVELDCRGTLAGDIATNGTGIAANRNGSSAHDYVQILRAGSFYENNWGPQVADIANAATGVSHNIGVICGPTTDPQSIGFFSSDAGRSSYYDQCYAYGNTTAISAATGAAKSSNSIFAGAIVGAVGAYNVATGL